MFSHVVTELIERMVSTRGIGGLNVVWIIWQSRGGSRRCVKKRRSPTRAELHTGQRALTSWSRGRVAME
jgi:hypothetical protein